MKFILFTICCLTIIISPNIERAEKIWRPVFDSFKKEMPKEFKFTHFGFMDYFFYCGKTLIKQNKLNLSAVSGGVCMGMVLTWPKVTSLIIKKTPEVCISKKENELMIFAKAALVQTKYLKLVKDYNSAIGKITASNPEEKKHHTIDFTENVLGPEFGYSVIRSAGFYGKDKLTNVIRTLKEWITIKKILK
jgi:hypothetical protein